MIIILHFLMTEAFDNRNDSEIKEHSATCEEC